MKSYSGLHTLGYLKHEVSYNIHDLSENQLTIFLHVNSHCYYEFQVEIGAVTNRDFNIKIAHKA